MHISISNKKRFDINTHTLSNIVEPERSLGSSYTHLPNTDHKINVYTKTNNSEHFEIMKDRITTEQVANAVHLAESSDKWSVIINLNSDISLNNPKRSKTQHFDRQHSLLRGNANCLSNPSLKAAAQTLTKYFHVTNFDPTVSEADLSQYLQTIVSRIKVHKLPARFPDKYSSLKISLPHTDAEKILIPEIWPEDVILNYFLPPRNCTSEVNQNLVYKF